MPFSSMLSRAFNADRRSNFSALDILNTTLLFVNKDERTTFKKLVSHGLEISSQLHHYRLFQKLLGEYEGIFNLSSMYLDAGSYCMKLRKSEQALDYIQKSANVLIQTQMQFSPSGLYTMTTYAKLLYQQGKFPEASRIFTSCIDITDKVYESDTLTKGYLLQNLAAVHASMRNAKAALMYYAQAESIFHKFLDEEPPDLLICKEQRENAIGMDGQKIDLLVEKNV